MILVSVMPAAIDHGLMSTAPALAIAVPVTIVLIWLLAGAPGADADAGQRLLCLLRRFAAGPGRTSMAGRRASMKIGGIARWFDDPPPPVVIALRQQLQAARDHAEKIQADLDRHKVLIVAKDELLRRQQNARVTAENGYEAMSRENAVLRDRLRVAEGATGRAQPPHGWRPEKSAHNDAGDFARLKALILRELHPDTATVIDTATATMLFKRLLPMIKDIERS